jgi:hypothetical protein
VGREPSLGWLPYGSVLEGPAIDRWSLLKRERVDTGQSGL